MFRTRLVLLACSVAVALMSIPGCTEEDSPTGASSSAVKLFVAGSDFQSGLLEWVGVEDNAFGAMALSICNDAAVRAHDGYVYILEKYGADNVMKVDPSGDGASAVVYQEHLGDNYNPSDIDFVSSTKAYVSNQNVPTITIFNPSAGEATSTIDISAYIVNPDSNTSPYANQMVLVGSDLYVSLQRRDGYVPGEATLILVIDTQTDSVTDTIACQYQNCSDMIYANGALYVANPGSSSSNTDGAIEKVDLATGAVTTVISETGLGGNPNQLAHRSGDRLYVMSYVGWEDVGVLEIDAAAGTVATTLSGITDAYGGICYDDVTGKLFVGERSADGMGVLVFENNTLTAGPLTSATSLPPSSMALVR